MCGVIESLANEKIRRDHVVLLLMHSIAATPVRMLRSDFPITPDGGRCSGFETSLLAPDGEDQALTERLLRLRLTTRLNHQLEKISIPFGKVIGQRYVHDSNSWTILSAATRMMR